MNRSFILLSLLIISVCVLCSPVLCDEDEARSTSACEWRDAYCKDNYKKDKWATTPGCKWVLRGGSLYDIYYDATYHGKTSSSGVSTIVSQTREVERERETQWKFGGIRYQPRYDNNNNNNNNNIVNNNNQQTVSGNNNNVKNEVTNNNNQQTNSNNGNSIFNISKWCLFWCKQEAELDEAQLDEAIDNKSSIEPSQPVAPIEPIKQNKPVIPKQSIKKLAHHRRNAHRNGPNNKVKVNVNVNVN
jgi:hypothetical protein